MRKKQILGIKTGDRVQGIPARFCRVLQLADGFDYALVETALHG
jgi:hypothetical protein